MGGPESVKGFLVPRLESVWKCTFRLPPLFRKRFVASSVDECWSKCRVGAGSGQEVARER